MSERPGICIDCGGKAGRTAERCTRCARDHRRNGPRREALERIQQQLADGTLTIRTMTAAERERWGPAKPVTNRARRAKRARTLAVPGKYNDPDAMRDVDENQAA